MDLLRGYSGDGFAAEHGSWNRSKPTGYKVIRIRLREGVPTGAYEDSSRVWIGDSEVWGRPVGVAVSRDGALLVSEDGKRHDLAYFSLNLTSRRPV